VVETTDPAEGRRGRRQGVGLLTIGIVLGLLLIAGGVSFFAMRAGVFSGGADEATSEERRIIEKLVKEETLGAAVSIEKIEKVPSTIWENQDNSGVWAVRYVYRYRNPPAGVTEVVDRIVLIHRGTPLGSILNPLGDGWKANWGRKQGTK
jgi:hypothetical protein